MSNSLCRPPTDFRRSRILGEDRPRPPLLDGSGSADRYRREGSHPVLLPPFTPSLLPNPFTAAAAAASDDPNSRAGSSWKLRGRLWCYGARRVLIPLSSALRSPSPHNVLVTLHQDQDSHCTERDHESRLDRGGDGDELSLGTPGRRPAGRRGGGGPRSCPLLDV